MVCYNNYVPNFWNTANYQNEEFSKEEPSACQTVLSF